MTPERLEEIRRRLEDCGPLDASAGRDGLDLLAEVERLRAELDGVRADREALDTENHRLQHALDNPALRDSVIAELDRELEAAHREELQAKAEAKRLREALAELLDAHQYGHGDRWCDAWAAARAAEPTP